MYKVRGDCVGPRVSALSLGSTRLPQKWKVGGRSAPLLSESVECSEEQHESGNDDDGPQEHSWKDS